MTEILREILKTGRKELEQEKTGKKDGKLNHVKMTIKQMDE